MEIGDEIKTIYGDIEKVMVIESSRIITYESARRLYWYHPTKVFNLGGSAFVNPAAD